MLNCLFVFSDHLAKGGTESVMLNIYNNIDKEKFHIDFLLFNDKPSVSEEELYLKRNGANIFYIIRRGENYIKHKHELKAFFKEHKYDIVHSHMDAIGAEILREAKKAGIKCRIAHSHNTNQLANPKGLMERLHKLFILLERQELRYYATDFIACSPEAGYWLFGEKKCNNKEHYIILKNAINTKKYVYNIHKRRVKRNEIGVLDESCKILGHIGRFDYQKNHEFLIDVFFEVKTKYNNCKLVLIGTGFNRSKIQKLVLDKGIDTDVIFLENRSDVPELLMAFDLFVFPSRYEGLSVALIEAQTSGLYCLASENISKSAKLVNGVEFLPIENTIIWRDRILELLNEHHERNSRVEEIKEAGYDMKTNIKELEKFYFKAVERCSM